jgi:hypothetical protein
MKNTTAIILLIAGLVFGYMGYDKMQNKNEGIKIGDLEISVTDKSDPPEEYIFFGLSAICLIGSVVVAAKGKK